jgi:hypothetical protein
MLCHETHLVAGRELVEPAIRHAVAVEIDLVAVTAQDKAAILLGLEAHYPPMVGNGMQFDITARLANVVFEQPAGGVERVADRDVHIFVRMVRRRIPADGDLAAGNFEVDSDPEEIALKMAWVAAFDDDAARRDPAEKALELFGPFAYPRGDGVGGIHVSEGNLKGELHGIFPGYRVQCYTKKDRQGLIQRNARLKIPSAKSRMAFAPLDVAGSDAQGRRRDSALW